MTPNGAISITGGILALTTAGCLWFFGRHMLPRTTLVLVLSGMVGLVATKIGSWGQTAVTWCNDQIANLIELVTKDPDITEPGTIVWSIGAFVLLAYVGFSFFQKQVDEKVLAAAAIAPIAAATIPGSAGAAITSGIGTIAAVATWPFAALFGLL